MMDFTAYLAAQHLTREAVSEALPDAPIRQDRVAVRRSARAIALRQRLSGTLRRLADLVEPRPEPAMAGTAGCR
jgi:hypothetical protein